MFSESGTVSGTYKENVKLKKTVEQLEEENNLLRLKVELLLDMVSHFFLLSINLVIIKCKFTWRGTNSKLGALSSLASNYLTKFRLQTQQLSPTKTLVSSGEK